MKIPENYYKVNTRILPSVRLIGEEHLEPPFIHKRRRPGEYILYFLTEGSMELTEDGIRYHLKPGDCLILDPEKVHMGTKATVCTYYYVHFSWDGLERINLCRTSSAGNQESDAEGASVREEMQRIRAESLRLSPFGEQEKIPSEIYFPKYYNYAEAEDYADLKSGLAGGILMHRDRREGYKTLISCCLVETVIRLSRIYLNEVSELRGGKGGIRKVYAILNFINVNYDRDITSSMLEEQFQGNFDYMNRIFRKVTGKTIFTYLSRTRIAAACELMKTTSLPISEIGQRVGFHDGSYFSKVFRKQTGVTPGEYAARNGMIYPEKKKKVNSTGMIFVDAASAYRDAPGKTV